MLDDTSLFFLTRSHKNKAPTYSILPHKTNPASSPTMTNDLGVTSS